MIPAVTQCKRADPDQAVSRRQLPAAARALGTDGEKASACQLDCAAADWKMAAPCLGEAHSTAPVLHGEFIACHPAHHVIRGAVGHAPMADGVQRLALLVVEGDGPGSTPCETLPRSGAWWRTLLSRARWARTRLLGWIAATVQRKAGVRHPGERRPRSLPAAEPDESHHNRTRRIGGPGGAEPFSAGESADFVRSQPPLEMRIPRREELARPLLVAPAPRAEGPEAIMQPSDEPRKRALGQSKSHETNALLPVR